MLITAEYAKSSYGMVVAKKPRFGYDVSMKEGSLLAIVFTVIAVGLAIAILAWRAKRHGVDKFWSWIERAGWLASVVSAALALVVIVTIRDNSPAATASSLSPSAIATTTHSSSPASHATTVTATETTPQTVQSPASIVLPESFVDSQWIGTLTQNRNPFPVRISLRRGFVGENVGTADYPTLHCSGRLVLVSASEAKLVVQLQIKVSVESCDDEDHMINLTKRPDGTLEYEIKAIHAFGTLSKQN